MSPIENVDIVDIVAVRKDGGVDLFIVTAQPLGAAEETQRLLLDKIESYLEQLNTDEFRAEFKHPPADKVTIVISCKTEPDPVIRKLVHQCGPWVSRNNARIELRVEPAQ